MVEAEKRLLANALADPDNQHFVLLSDRLFLIAVGEIGPPLSNSISFRF